MQKFGVASNIILAYDNLIVNPAWWNGLPADARKGILDAVARAEARAIPAADGIPAEHIQQLRDKGMTVTVLTKAQEKVMADAMQPAVIKAFIEASPDGARLIEMMRKL